MAKIPTTAKKQQQLVAQAKMKTRALGCKLEDLIKQLKKILESTGENLHMLRFYFALLSATIEALKFIVDIQKKFSHSKTAAGMGPIVACGVFHIFKETTLKIMYGNVNACGDDKGQGIAMWKSRCWRKTEEFDMMIRREFCEVKIKGSHDEESWNVRVFVVILVKFVHGLWFVMKCRRTFGKLKRLRMSC